MASAQQVDDKRRHVISFILGRELYGFDLHMVNKVIEVPDFFFVPRAPSFTRGVISHRGKVIAVVDLSEFLGMGTARTGPDHRILVIASSEYHLGFLVDRVERIEYVPVRGPLVQPSSGENPYVSKIVNLGGRIFNLIDLEKLLAEIEEYFA